MGVGASVCCAPFSTTVDWRRFNQTEKTLDASPSKTVAPTVVDSASLGLERTEVALALQLRNQR